MVVVISKAAIAVESALRDILSAAISVACYSSEKSLFTGVWALNLWRRLSELSSRGTLSVSVGWSKGMGRDCVRRGYAKTYISMTAHGNKL